MPKPTELEELFGGCPTFKTETERKAFERGAQDGLNNRITNPFSFFVENELWRLWIIGFKTCYTFPNFKSKDKK